MFKFVTVPDFGLETLFYYIKTRQLLFYRRGPENHRWIGFECFWYDGPHIEIGFYFFYILLTNYKDDKKYRVKYKLKAFVSKLFNKKFIK